KIRAEEGRIQRETFEPGNFLPRCRKPVLWVTHPTDTPPDELERSYQTTPGPNTLCVTNQPGHVTPNAIGNGDRIELATFADHHFRGTEPLATLTQPIVQDRRIKLTHTGPVRARFAALHWTTELSTIWNQRTWQTAKASINGEQVTAEL